MAELINISINLSKVFKDRIINGDKGKYLNLTIAVNDEKDKFGNDVSCWQGQTKEQRESGEKKNYLGNGKVFWQSNFEQQPTNTTAQNTEDTDDDLPF